MSPFNLLGLISTFALFLPVLLLLITRLAWYRTFPALFTYFFLIFAYNFVMLGYVDLPKDFRVYFGITNNFLDAPLMLMFLSYFSRTPVFRKRMRIALYAFLVFELVVVLLYGYTLKSSVIIAGPGLVLVATFALLFFIHQVKITVIYHKAAGKALMASSILFAYVGFLYVFIVFYFMNASYRNDAHLVYFLIIIFSCISMSAGIIMERKRVRQLAEIKTTRQELKALYAGQERMATPPLETIVFNFDKKWN